MALVSRSRSGRTVITTDGDTNNGRTVVVLADVGAFTWSTNHAGDAFTFLTDLVVDSYRI